MSDNKRSGLSGQALKAANSAISKLRKAGLYAGKAARGQPTKYALSLIKKFSDVVSGRAKTIKSNEAAAERYAGKFKTAASGKRLIIPTSGDKSEVTRVTKSGKIISYGKTETGKSYSREVQSGDGIRPLKKGERYALPIRRGRKGTSYRYFDSLEQIRNFINLGSGRIRAIREVEGREKYAAEWMNEIEIVK